MKFGQVRARPLTGPAEQLLSQLDDPASPLFAGAIAGVEELARQEDEKKLSAHAERLRKLAGGDQPAARAAALRALSRTRDLSQVPLLLEALKDPDPDVYAAAIEGLEFISRRWSRTAAPPPDDEASRVEARRTWTLWYQAIEPNADVPR
jgi:HEAT repeat protein